MKDENIEEGLDFNYVVTKETEIIIRIKLVDEDEEDDDDIEELENMFKTMTLKGKDD